MPNSKSDFYILYILINRSVRSKSGDDFYKRAPKRTKIAPGDNTQIRVTRFAQHISTIVLIL